MFCLIYNVGKLVLIWGKFRGRFRFLVGLVLFNFRGILFIFIVGKFVEGVFFVVSIRECVRVVDVVVVIGFI